MNTKTKSFPLALLAFAAMTACGKIAGDQNMGTASIGLETWKFSKDSSSWEEVTLPHCYNAQDGHSPAYYRGKAFYVKEIEFKKKDLGTPVYLLLEGAAQQSDLNVNGKFVSHHQGGYNAFYTRLDPYLKEGLNTIEVSCDNHEDMNVPPVTSDFNKNGGLVNPASLLKLKKLYFAPESYGLYRLHVSTPEVSPEKATAMFEAAVGNVCETDGKVSVIFRLTDAEGKIAAEKKIRLRVTALSEGDKVSAVLEVAKPHLWDGLKAPYLYKATAVLESKNGKILDMTETKVGFRSYSFDKDKGFMLNGRPYPLRGVAEHQDMDGKALAMDKEDFEGDYEIIKELGCNFLRLAHYPHNDYEYRLCDSLGLVVQTEIPWVNVCGLRAEESYFMNIESQFREMVANLYNHPSIVFWGFWNELASWANNEAAQGALDAEKVVSQTEKLYGIAKELDPYRLAGVTDCTIYRDPGYENIKGDFFSENRYNGWYYSMGNFEAFTLDMDEIHAKMGPTNVAEYGAGVNPFCHTSADLSDLKVIDAGKHFEEYGNLFHESHVRQISKLDYLGFSSLWILFDFPVAARQEGFMDSDDGVHFSPNEARKYMNDKGLVTRDRKVKKDVFYLYKSLWNHDVTTVYITSRRLLKVQAGKPYSVKVYSNAPSLKLYVNGGLVQILDSCPDETGVIWTFAPVKLGEGLNKIRVEGGGASDEVSLEGTDLAREAEARQGA